jgi:protein-disulfide isomerase-like protein with CxxC motif
LKILKATSNNGYYGQGLPLDSETVLGDLAAAQGVERATFLDLWRSDEAKAGTQTAFTRARAAGVTMYPTLFYRRGENILLIGRGFIEPDAAVNQVASARGAG